MRIFVHRVEGIGVVMGSIRDVKRFLQMNAFEGVLKSERTFM